MRSLRKSLRGHFWKRVIAYVLVWSLVMNTSVPLLLAGPTGGAVDTGLNGGGTADITYNTGLYGHTTLVDVDTNRTIINWTSLNTVGGAADVRETLSFTQGALTNSAVLNRVSGAATQFYGDLTAPGMRIFVVNPAGMVFGPGSTVNVSQLVLSGLGMTNEAFNNTIQLGDEMVFSGGAGSVYTRALVNAGSVYLVGKKVTNNGSILAPNGVIVLAAGDNVQIAQDGSNVISQILVDPGETTPDIDNRSLLAAKNGSIYPCGLR